MAPQAIEMEGSGISEGDTIVLKRSLDEFCDEETGPVPKKQAHGDSTQLEKTPTGGSVSLSDQILKKYEEVRKQDFNGHSSPDDFFIKFHIRLVNRCFSQSFSNVSTLNLHCVGSASNGLALKDCDIDMYCRTPRVFRHQTNQRTLKMIDDNLFESFSEMYSLEDLNKIGLAVKREDYICYRISRRMVGQKLKPEYYKKKAEESKMFEIAGQPVLRMKYFGKDHVNLNLSFSNSVRSSHLLKVYADIDERFRPLAIVVKLWARVQRIHSSVEGPLSSYSLMLMLVHYLQVGCQPPVLPNLHKIYPDTFKPNSQLVYLKDFVVGDHKSTNKKSLGDLLIGFLEYYAQYFNYKQYAISISEVCMVKKKTSYPIEIEEPFTKKNVCKSVQHKNYPGLLESFKSSYNKLKSSQKLSTILANDDTIRRIIHSLNV